MCFYVYQLADPRTGTVFYVGKGQNRRAWDHERAVAAGKSSGNRRKDDVIRDILAYGLCVDVQIVAEYADETDALDHEYRLVDAMPTLTNVQPGGIGWAETPAQRDRRRARFTQAYLLRRAKLLRQREEQAREKALARERVACLAVPGADPVEVDLWLRGIVEVKTQPKGLGNNRRKLRRRAA
jgi:hypothetical protein